MGQLIILHRVQEIILYTLESNHPPLAKATPAPESMNCNCNFSVDSICDSRRPLFDFGYTTVVLCAGLAFKHHSNVSLNLGQGNYREGGLQTDHLRKCSASGYYSGKFVL